MYLCFLGYINYCFFLSQHDRYNSLIVRQELAQPLHMDSILQFIHLFSSKLFIYPLYDYVRQIVHYENKKISEIILRSFF